LTTFERKTPFGSFKLMYILLHREPSQIVFERKESFVLYTIVYPRLSAKSVVLSRKYRDILMTTVLPLKWF